MTSKNYNPKTFLRKAPNYLLQEYFHSKGLLKNLNITEMKETKIDPLYDAFAELPEDVQSKVHIDFKIINKLSNEGALKTIIREAKTKEINIDIIPIFDEMKGFIEKAFYTFLNFNKLFEEAIIVDFRIMRTFVMSKNS